MERKFLFKYEDAYSDLKGLRANEPQSSVMRPLLYLLYTKDILHIVI